MKIEVKALAVGAAFVLVVASCSSSTTGIADETATSSSDTTQVEDVSTTTATQATEPTGDTEETSTSDEPTITDRAENRASVAITVAGETYTEELEEDGRVLCTTYGEERDTSTVGLDLTGVDLSLGATTTEPGTDPGTYQVDLGAFAYDDVIDSALGGWREGTGTLTLERVMEIEPDVAGDLWLFEGSISGNLDDGGPEATVEMTFACIGHVGWSATP